MMSIQTDSGIELHHFRIRVFDLKSIFPPRRLTSARDRVQTETMTNWSATHSVVTEQLHRPCPRASYLNFAKFWVLATLISVPRHKIGHSQYYVSGIKIQGFAPAISPEFSGHYRDLGISS